MIDEPRVNMYDEGYRDGIKAEKERAKAASRIECATCKNSAVSDNKEPCKSCVVETRSFVNHELRHAK